MSAPTPPTPPIPEGRQEISVEELGGLIKRQGPTVAMNLLEVHGVVTILDKDGNVKSKLEIVALDPDEEI